MTKRTRITLITVGLVLAAYPALAWLSGIAVESQLGQREQQGLLEAPYLVLEKRDYHRGVFRATEELTFRLHSPFETALRAMSGVAHSPPLRLTVRNVIYHGPLPRLQAFALATVDTALVWPPERAAHLDASAPARPVAAAAVHTRVGWLGGSVTTITGAVFELHLPHDTVLSSQDFAATLDTDRGFESGSIKLHAGGFSLHSSDARGDVEGVELDATTRRVFNSYRIGTGKFSIAKFDAAKTNGTPMSMQRLSVRWDSSLNGEYVNSQAQFVADALHIGEFSGSRLGYSASVTHINGLALVALTDAFRDAERGASAAPATATQAPVFAALRQHGADILIHDPVVEISRIGFATPEGELRLSGKFAVTGLKREDYDAAGLAAVVPHLHAVADLRMDSTLVNKLLDRGTNREAIETQIAALEHQGYLTRGGPAFISHLVFEAGKLSVHGHPYPPTPAP